MAAFRHLNEMPKTACHDDIRDSRAAVAGFVARLHHAPVSGRTLDALCKQGTLLTLGKGEDIPLLTGQGTVACICEGATKLIATASRQREQIVAFHFRGDLVSIPQSGEHAYSMKALKDSEVLLFAAEAFLKIARGDPGLLEATLVRTQTALFRCRDKAVGLGRKSASERMASFLMIMAERIGTNEGGGCLLDLPMSRRDIGDSLGLTIETVSRQIGEFRELGLAETDGRSRIFLPDLKTLSIYTGHV
ncbi:MAG: Crp/Fnr family transcriptional regulator [Erythrobacter sp.]|nr:Crp/Fnr family transcriptional regulator [Erythrobacter sp.]